LTRLLQRVFRKTLKRLIQHNNGECLYTSRKLPWVLVYIEPLPTKRDALILERGLTRFTASINQLRFADGTKANADI